MSIKWQKYYDLEPIKRLKNEGRELLGKRITITEKRDGENVSIWLNKTNSVHISSHNLEVASEDIIGRLKETFEYKKIIELLIDEKTFNHNYIVYGELIKRVCPTRIEPPKKHVCWILFDIYDCKEQRYLEYTLLYQKAYHYKIPIVKLLDEFIPTSLEEIETKITEYKKWCKRHRREGIVGKNYSDQIFFKEKIDLPKIPKLKHIEPNQIQYPPMPQDRILRALQHAFDEVGEEKWKNVKISMPIVAKHFQIEAKEHNFASPRNMYQLYLNTSLELIKNGE
jgi:ATP-dependent RNA circularization protein (DNA/RNA ligase family)